MLFSSIPFLYYFLPCAVLLYFLAPKRLKNTVLLLLSLFFYGWGEPRYLVFMAASIVQGYVFGRLIGKYRGRRLAKVFLAASVLFSLSLLGYCKYADFFIANFNAVTGLSVPLLQIALPIGISFYTFQILSYAADVYRGVPAQKNFIRLAVYIAMFPQLVAGPIVRYADIEPQLAERVHTFEGAAAGVRRFVFGLSKKVLLANVLGALVEAFKASEEKSVLYFWLYAAAYTLQVYFDFSGYSDMAIGLGRIFGFRFAENFDHPYAARSITAFWRRWHISLGTWFRDYLYIPLGGNRVSRPRWLLNILVVWMATGLWHGAAWSFVVWGLWFAALLMLEKLWLLPRLERCRWLGHAYTLFFVVLGFVIFDAASISDAAASIAALFGGAGLPAATAESAYMLRSYAVVLGIAAIAATPLPQRIAAAMQSRRRIRPVLYAAEPVVLLGLLAVCTAFLVDGSFNPFLYFRF